MSGFCSTSNVRCVRADHGGYFRGDRHRDRIASEAAEAGEGDAFNSHDCPSSQVAAGRGSVPSLRMAR
jgi:hypothetical protein